MKKTICPACGEKSLHKAKGCYVFKTPPSVPGSGVVRIKDAQWEICDSCGESIIGDKFHKAIDASVKRRVKKGEKRKTTSVAEERKPISEAEAKKRISLYYHGQKVVLVPENKVYDYGYLGYYGDAIIYYEGECNMQDAIAVDFNDIRPLKKGDDAWRSNPSH